MQVAVLPVTPFQQNCSILRCQKTGRAAVVDPGGEIDRIIASLAELDAELEKVLLTHAHIDHAGGAQDLSERLGVPIEGPHRDDAFLIEQMESQAMMFGFRGARQFEPTRWLEGGDQVVFGEVSLEVVHCPGHTPGHVVFFHAAEQLAFVGDVIFQGSIGRTDFPRGSHATLLASIRDRLMPLGDDVRFVPGHGPTSTLGQERANNPFLVGEL